MVNSPIRFIALSSSACTGSPLRCLSASIPDRFLTPLLEPEDLYAQLARQKLHRLVTQKPQNDLTLARHRPSLAKSQRACRQSLAWGKRGRAKLARIYHRPINSNFLLKIIGHVPVLLGHFD